MSTKIRTFSVITFTLLLPLSFSGCIDIHWADSILYEEPVVITYSEHTKWTLEYYFEGGSHEEERPVHINKNTVWMNITIEVYMEQAGGAIRHVYITLYEPGDKPGVFKEYEHREYVATAFDNIYVEDPKVGQWKVLVEGLGVGIGSIQDGYKLEVTTYEPD